MDVGDPGGMDIILMDEGIPGETNELNKPLNKSQCTLIHVGDGRRDERVRTEMSTK